MNVNLFFLKKVIHPVIPLMFFFTLQFGFSQGIETAIISGIHEESQEDLMFLKNELKDKSFGRANTYVFRHFRNENQSYKILA